MKLYRVAFVAGKEGAEPIQFDAWVTAENAEAVEPVCQRQVQPLQIAHFLEKTGYIKPQFILISSRPTKGD